MNELDVYLQKWNLSDPVQLAKTPTSHVFRVRYKNAYAVLKLLTPAGRTYEAIGALALQCFSGHGAVELFQADDGAHLISFADGISLKHLVIEGDDRQAAEIICSILDRVHRYRGQVPKEIISLSERFRSLFKMAHQKNCDSIFSLAAQIAERLLQSEKNVVLLHGDIHHSNILQSTVKGWVSIDPQPVVGERVYDIANSFYNPEGLFGPVESPDRILMYIQIFSEHLKVAPERVARFAFVYGCLSACWSIEDGQSPDRALRIARLIESLKV